LEVAEDFLYFLIRGCHGDNDRWCSERCPYSSDCNRFNAQLEAEHLRLKADIIEDGAVKAREDEVEA
jgi:hypothetical protein